VIKLQEKRQVGSVYCITKIDKYGKCENGFVPLPEVEIDEGGKTLGKHIAGLEKRIKTLESQNKILTRAFGEIIKNIGGINDEAN
jgi:hypothetical protein